MRKREKNKRKCGKKDKKGKMRKKFDIMEKRTQKGKTRKE